MSPLVRGRKGHYRELFEDMRKKGYLKVRVDGEILDLVPKMQVDRYKIHDIELVIDRLAASEDMRVRLGQSLQKAMQTGKDLVFIQPGDSTKVVQYSKQLMCSETGISYEEPSPNTFSFNSPYGACPHCKGLGQIYSVDMDSVIPDRSLSIEAGAIVPLGEARDAFTYKQVEQLAKKYKFSLKSPVKDISEKALNRVLYGNEEGPAELQVSFDESSPAYETDYEGVVNMVVRWFSGSSSDAVREWAEKFMQLKTCTTCEGARLKKESLWFKVNEKNIAELGDMNLDKLGQWFSKIEKDLQ